jgi:hypothetical protein
MQFPNRTPLNKTGNRKNENLIAKGVATPKKSG